MIAEDVAQALAYLHKQRVVHLDIKSRNVLLTKYAPLVNALATLESLFTSDILSHAHLLPFRSV